MTRHEVLDAMYRDPDVADAIGKMEPADLRDDLRQEMFLVLAELDEERLLTMAREGWVKFFLVRTMLNMIKSDRSTFYNKFRRGFAELKETGDRYEAEEGEEAARYVRDAMKGLHWYEASLIELYAESGQNIAKISRDTRIPYRSLFKTIGKVKETMRKEIRKGEQDTQRVRLRLAIEVELPARADVDAIIDHIDLLDAGCREAIVSRGTLTKYSGFKIGKIG
jgi:DNA-directed RNA polymerase specialized sigma24 family protein